MTPARNIRLFKPMSSNPTTTATTDDPRLDRQTATRLADAIPDLIPDYRDCIVFPTQTQTGHHGIRIATPARERTPTKLPAAIQRWIRKTPAFELDNPHVNQHGTLFIDIVPAPTHSH